MENNKISSHQLYALTASMALGGSILVISASVAGVAKQDAWLSALVASILGLAVIWVFCYLGSQYPGLTLIGISKKILGKWVGLAVCIGYVFFTLKTATHLPWYIANYTTYTMHETPQYAIELLTVIAIVIAILYGIETIGRAVELFLTFIGVVFFGAMIFVLPSVNLQNLQPVLESGVVPVLKGAVLIMNFTVFPVVVIMMIYPINVEDIQRGEKAMLKGFLFTSLVAFSAILMSTLVLGPTLSAKLSYPTLVLFKEITIGAVLTRLEHAISIIWIISQFTVGTLYAYAGIVGLAELLGLKDYKRIVIPIGLIIFVMSQVAFPDTVYQANYVGAVYPALIMTFGLVIPMVLLGVHFVKKVVLKKE